jgi:hypothetical protein
MAGGGIGIRLAAAAGMSNQTTVDSAARSDVVNALGRLERGERNALDGFRSALCTFIGTLRDHGVARETVVESVRAVVSAPATPEGARTLHPSAREALIEMSINWCADEFGPEV